MRRANVRDLHLRTSALIKEVEKGRVIVIEKRGVPVAELRPTGRVSRQEMLRGMRALAARLPRTNLDSTAVISEMRDR